MRYKTKDEFVVTVSVPCPCCKVFVEEKTIQERSRYIYGYGWVEQTGCEKCFAEALSEAQAIADEKTRANRASIFTDYEGWDYV